MGSVNGWDIAKLGLVAVVMVTTIVARVTAPQRCVTGVVVGAERVISNGSSKYRVYLDGGQVFTNHDAIERLKFNSGTIQSRLLQAHNSGTPVTLTVYGYRIPVLSMMENIATEGCRL